MRRFGWHPSISTALRSSGTIAWSATVACLPGSSTLIW
uniref:Uncharacterized protein n=1 Tax=Arundo donax TaxID=35708 RepID=A0A0A9CQC2_ARUDO